MKAVLHSENGELQSGDKSREWTPARVLRIALAAVLLVGVYLAAGLLPTESGSFNPGAVGSFVMFWVLGGVFTITLLAASDRRG